MATGWGGQGNRSHPSTLAECMVCPSWAAELESGTRVDADNRPTTNPLTGEPDAGNPPVRFGERGKVQTLVPTPYRPSSGVVSGCATCAERFAPPVDKRRGLSAYCALIARAMVGYPSGQRGQTVNLLAYAFTGSNPVPTTISPPRGGQNNSVQPRMDTNSHQ